VTIGISAARLRLAKIDAHAIDSHDCMVFPLPVAKRSSRGRQAPIRDRVR